MNENAMGVVECGEILKYYGPLPQMVKAIEEMAELTQLLAKFFNSDPYANGKDDLRERIREEIADVAIMNFQMMIHFGTEEILQKAESKIQRTLARIAREKHLKDHPYDGK